MIFQLRSNAGSELEPKESSDFVCPGTIPPALHEAALLHILCPVPALPQPENLTPKKG